MKILRIISFVLGLCAGMSGFGQERTITITNPANGATWYAGHTYRVSWTWTGNIPSIKLHFLWEDYPPSIWGPHVMPIVDWIPNTGSYEWTIDPNAHWTYGYIMIDGTNQIEVYTQLTIAQPSHALEIASKKPRYAEKDVVVDPLGKDVLAIGNSQTISWKVSQKWAAGACRIELWQGGQSVRTIKTDMNPGALTNSFAWTVGQFEQPGSVSIGGGGYSIRVLYPMGGPSCYGEAGPFSIQTLGPPPIKKLALDPLGKSTLLIGAAISLSWKVVNPVGSAELDLFQYGRKVGHIATVPCTPGDSSGKYIWAVRKLQDRISARVGDGYTIRITYPSAGGDYKDSSSPFAIRNPTP